jgi:transposase-like protein
LVKMSVTEQRYRAVLEVHAGATVTDVADRFGVSRQAVHRWLGWYADHGLEGLADRSSRPHSSPGQTPPEMEAAICELRRNHPRLDHGVLHLLDADRTLLRSLPNPLSTAEQSRLRDARPAGPPPAPPAGPPRVDRRVNCRGTLMIAGQRIDVGIRFAGRTVVVEATDATFNDQPPF